MPSLLKRFSNFLVRRALSVHCKVKVSDRKAAKGFQGIVIGMGHVSYMDPPIVITQLAKSGVFPRPVVYSKMYDALRWIMRRVGGFRVESLQDGASDYVAMKIGKTVGNIKTAVRNGETILIYASGQTKPDIKESLGGKSSVFELVQDNPGVPVLIVNIYGLWGSLWSRYFTGGAGVPSWRHKLAIIARHPIRFLRRVKVELDYKLVTLPSFGTPRELNQFLEDQYHEKPDWLIPGRDKCHVKGYERTSHSDLVDVAKLKSEVVKKVIAYLSRTSHVPAAQISLDKRLEEDLGLDSLERTKLLLWVDEEFGKHVDHNANIMLVQDLVAAAQGFFGEVETDHKVQEAPSEWLRASRVDPGLPKNAPTIGKMLIKQARRQGLDSVACGDDLSGFVTNRKLIEKSCLLAQEIRRSPDPVIGLMLPISVASTVVTLATIICGKKLASLNWTNGKVTLEQTVALSEVNAIYSSENFLQKASVPITEDTFDKIVPLESLRGKLGLKELLISKFLARFPSLVLWYFGNKAKPEDVAIILFTSGSEAAPKGVPLSHRNILSNVDGVLRAVGGKRTDRQIGFAPSFHSLGMTLIKMLGVTTGMRTWYEADPKRFKKIAKSIEKYQATILGGTPDFIAGILNVVGEKKDMLKSLRMIIAGAQKVPESLKQRVRSLGIVFIEGYGITETSPLICINRPGEEAIGVGPPIYGSTLLIVDIETKSIPKADGETGLILTAGPNVFSGYLGDVPSPFVTVRDVRYYQFRWYNTGDLGYIEKGSLVITGRLKRFRKFMGEMINLTMIEDTLASAYPGTESGPRVSVEAGPDQEGAPPVIVLYTIHGGPSLEEANKVLSEKGFKSYCFVRRRIELAEIPLLGSGKVNHRALPDPEKIALAA